VISNDGEKFDLCSITIYAVHLAQEHPRYDPDHTWISKQSRTRHETGIHFAPKPQNEKSKERPMGSIGWLSESVPSERCKMKTGGKKERMYISRKREEGFATF
jgi:hypothetical protein